MSELVKEVTDSSFDEEVGFAQEVRYAGEDVSRKGAKTQSRKAPPRF